MRHHKAAGSVPEAVLPWLMQGAREEDRRDEIGIWSLSWGKDGQTIVAGTNNESLYIYDANVRRVRACQCWSKHDRQPCCERRSTV